MRRTSRPSIGNIPTIGNRSTTISYALPEARPVRLTVFDVLGREVAVLVNGLMPAGRHEASWKTGVPTGGVYLYRIEAGEWSAVRAMMVVR